MNKGQIIAMWILIIGCLAIYQINETNDKKQLQYDLEQAQLNKQALEQQLSDERRQKVADVPVKQGCDLLDNAERDVCMRNEPYTNWDCTKFSDFSFTIECYQTKAREEKNPQYCVKLKTDYDRDNCYMGVANAMNNPEICMGIIFPDIRLSCYQKINLKGISPDVCNSGWTLDERHQCRELIMEANDE